MKLGSAGKPKGLPNKAPVPTPGPCLNKPAKSDAWKLHHSAVYAKARQLFRKSQVSKGLGPDEGAEKGFRESGLRSSEGEVEAAEVKHVSQKHVFGDRAIKQTRFLRVSWSGPPA